MSKAAIKVHELVRTHETLETKTNFWTAQLHFVVSVHPFPISTPSPSLIGSCYGKQDLFQLVSGPCSQLFKWYFDPTIYPPDGDFKTSSASSVRLLKDIKVATAPYGFSLVTNGHSNNVHSIKRLACSRFRRSKASIVTQRDPSDYRVSLIRSNKLKGSRGPEGKTFARRTDSILSHHSDHCCPVKLKLGVDHSGFFVDGRNGCSTHQYHSNATSLASCPPSLNTGSISSQGLHLVQTLRAAGLSYNATAHAFHMNEGMRITNGQVCYWTQNISYMGGTGKPGERPSLKTTSADRLLSELQMDKHDHIVLIHKAETNTLVGQQQIGADLTDDFQFTAFWPEKERERMNTFISSQRLTRKIPEKQDMFLAVVWMTKGERELFRKYPFVLKMDTTFGTNDRSLPLMTVTGKTANGNVFTIVRAYIPNEQAWVFRWFLCHALKNLLSTDLQRVNLIISDGDSQEIHQVNNLIDEFCPHVHRIRCGWHVVDRGWDRLVYHIAKDPMKSKFRYFETSRRILFSWAYSWMTPGCETEAEYNLSKALFIKLLDSDEMLARVGPFF
jgi:hypothetical protein